MKNIIKYAALCILVAMASCSKSSDSITPADISDITSEAGAGFIKLKWQLPEDRSSIYYTKVSYYDHLAKKNMWRLSSVDTLLIPDTRAKYGEYEFKLETFSSTDTSNGNVHKFKAVSGVAPKTEKADRINIKAEHLSTNAQEPSEGPIKNLVEDNSASFFHSKWSSPIPAAPHYIDIDLSWRESITDFRIGTTPRNANNIPVDIDLFGSTDGEEWFLIKNITKEKNNIPTNGKDSYESETFKSERPFNYFRYSVNKTNTNSVFWSMAIFKLYTVEVYDPEAPDEE